MIALVTAPRVWLMREPSKSAPKETELLFGHLFHIERTKKKWVYGQTLSPLEQDVEGYKGWALRKTFSEDFEPRTHSVDALKAPVFKSADIKSHVKRLLPLGAQVNAARIGEKFIELASGGFAHPKHLRSIGDFPISDFVTIAEQHIGLPYVWGGISSDGLDCSGLVQTSLRAIGTDCLRDASQQEISLGTVMDLDAPLKRGDLIFWPGHVGVMSGENRLLHANAFHMKVTEEPLDGAIKRIGMPRTIKRL